MRASPSPAPPLGACVAVGSGLLVALGVEAGVGGEVAEGVGVAVATLVARGVGVASGVALLSAGAASLLLLEHETARRPTIAAKASTSFLLIRPLSARPIRISTNRSLTNV